MPLIKTIQAGNPIVQKRSCDVMNIGSENTQRIITDLIDTMRAEDLVGMAAPQIGENVRIFVTEVRETQYRKDNIDELRIFVNPEIIKVSKEVIEGHEGCGSVASAQLFGPVLRSAKVTVRAFDRDGKEFEYSAAGLLARVIQHEVDHLNGILFVEKISDMKKVMSKEEYLKTIRK